MASDQSPPRNGLILGIAVASVFTLGTLKFVFDSYYRYIMEEEVAAKAAPPTEIRAARLEEQQKLATGPMPIDKAIQEVAKEREALIQPQQSTDDGPLIGWSKLPHNVAPTVPTTTADGGAAVAAALDAGASPPIADAGPSRDVAGDAGAAPHAAADGGTKGPGTLQGPATGPKVTDAGGAK